MEFTPVDFEKLLSYIWPLFRISGMLMVMPIIGSDLIPTRIKVIIAIALTFVVSIQISTFPIMNFDIKTLMMAGFQLFIGISFGMVLQVIFQSFVFAGQLVGQQMGLGFASMNDPQNGVSIPQMGQFYGLMATLLFLVFNGHIIAIQILVNSFTHIPIGWEGIAFGTIHDFVGWGAWMFINGLYLSLPVIATLLLINFSFGVMTRATPQLNIFSLGFPITMLLGFVIILFCINLLVPGFKIIFDQVFEQLSFFSGAPD